MVSPTRQGHRRTPGRQLDGVGRGTPVLHTTTIVGTAPRRLPQRRNHPIVLTVSEGAAPPCVNGASLGPYGEVVVVAAQHRRSRLGQWDATEAEECREHLGRFLDGAAPPQPAGPRRVDLAGLRLDERVLTARGALH